MIIGLLNCDSDVAVKNIELSLRNSGLLQYTNKIYYCNKMFNFNNSEHVIREVELFNKVSSIKKENNIFIWSLNTTTYNMSKEQCRDWLAFQLFFIVENWKYAIKILQNGWDMYGVNLFQYPSIHYQNNCFWAKQFCDKPLTYNVFSSGINHYLQSFKPSEYRDFNPEIPAPLSSKRILDKLDVTDELIKKFIYVFSTKNFYDPHPTRISKRPYIITDFDDIRILDFFHLGNCYITFIGKFSHYLPQGLNFQMKQPSIYQKADIIVTSKEKSSELKKYLLKNGTIINYDS